MPLVAYEKLTDYRMGEPSATIQERVENARKIQRVRVLASGLACNADTRSGPADVRASCKQDDAGTSLMRSAMSQL